jgi:pimeloyl-ACP methyl ester carboxylesterase
MRILLLLALMLGSAPLVAVASPQPASVQSRYGANPQAGATFEHGGVRFYYEIYGAGEPLLLIHGNGGSIRDWSRQIEHFQKDNRVIAMDSRDHGRSGDSAGELTYEIMADDQVALLNHLKIPEAHVLGWSDGGIQALVMGMRYPARVRKLVSMAANLRPDAVVPETKAFAEHMFKQAKAANPKTVQSERDRKGALLMITQPQIDPKSLNNVKAPTLVLAGDHDLILDTHTIEIFNNLPNGQLGIIPDAVHTAPYDDSVRFNAAVDRFLTQKFVQRERIDDVVKSVAAMRASQN